MTEEPKRLQADGDSGCTCKMPNDHHSTDCAKFDAEPLVEGEGGERCERCNDSGRIPADHSEGAAGLPCPDCEERCPSCTATVERVGCGYDDIRYCADPFHQPPVEGEAGERCNELEAAIHDALGELGVPGDGYPTPISNAVEILNRVLDRDPASSGEDGEERCPECNRKFSPCRECLRIGKPSCSSPDHFRHFDGLENKCDFCGDGPVPLDSDAEERVRLTYADLPEEAVRVAASMVRGILYNLDDAPYDEELIAKNTVLFVLNAVGWQPTSTPSPAPLDGEDAVPICETGDCDRPSVAWVRWTDGDERFEVRYCRECADAVSSAYEVEPDWDVEDCGVCGVPSDSMVTFGVGGCRVPRCEDHLDSPPYQAEARLETALAEITCAKENQAADGAAFDANHISKEPVETAPSGEDGEEAVPLTLVRRGVAVGGKRKREHVSFRGGEWWQEVPESEQPDSLRSVGYEVIEVVPASELTRVKEERDAAYEGKGKATDNDLRFAYGELREARSAIATLTEERDEARREADSAMALQCCDPNRTGKHESDCPRIRYQDASEGRARVIEEREALIDQVEDLRDRVRKRAYSEGVRTDGAWFGASADGYRTARAMTEIYDALSHILSPGSEPD